MGILCVGLVCRASRLLVLVSREDFDGIGFGCSRVGVGFFCRCSASYLNQPTFRIKNLIDFLGFKIN